jgi:hypothetical protein
VGLSRIVGVLLIFGAIALGVVALRAEEARTARRIQQAELEMVRIRRALWSVQLGIAQYKSPRRIGEEVHSLALELAAPATAPPARGGDVRWAKAR